MPEPSFHPARFKIKRAVAAAASSRTTKNSKERARQIIIYSSPCEKNLHRALTKNLRLSRQVRFLETRCWRIFDDDNAAAARAGAACMPNIRSIITQGRVRMNPTHA